MKKFFETILPIITLITLPLILGTLGYTWYRGYYYTQTQNVRYAELEQKLLEQSQLLASTTSALSDSIAIIEGNLNLTKSESTELSEKLAQSLFKQQQKVASLQTETSKIGGTVGTLEKLSQTDPELLKKYSKISFLNENYVPKKLSEIKNQYLYSEDKTKYFLTDALPFLTTMLEDAEKAGITIYVSSAYRSFNEQDKLKNAYTVTYGEGANAFSADQGYSEHQLGTTVDLITTGLGGQLSGFDKTNAFTWLQSNAYKYGFALSYPAGNAYYIYEPWHWRFVGKDLAKKLHNEDSNFYDLEQRTIDTYLVSLFD